MVNKIELDIESVIAQLGTGSQNFKRWKEENFLNKLKSKRFPELVSKITQPAISNKGLCLKPCK